MSNSLAIAAATATLRNLLHAGLTADVPDATVTTKALDKARDGNSANQVNLFLYRTETSGAWRNIDMPRQVQHGETGRPPLGLNLYYLITAYGKDDDDALGHRLLGRAMSLLHDHPLLGAEEIKTALPGNDLHEQVERVRITPEPLSVDEMSKLWTTFQSQYRISAAYQVAVVLIESRHRARTPLPVLTRGPGDEGVTAQADLVPPFPTLESMQLPNRQPSARLGDVLTLRGHHLDGGSVVVRFMNRRLSEAIQVAPQSGHTATEIAVQIPNQPAKWVAGFYAVAAVISPTVGPDRMTNELSFPLAPRIVGGVPATLARDGDGNVSLTLTCSPEVTPAQRAALLLGDREILAAAHTTQTASLTFNIVGAPVGEHFVRLRVDGVDSLLVDRSQTPPVFDTTQKVTIT